MMRGSLPEAPIGIHIESGSFCASEGHPALVLYMVDPGNSDSLDHVRSWRPDPADEMCVRKASAWVVGLGSADDQGARLYAEQQDIPFKTLDDANLGSVIQNYMR